MSREDLSKFIIHWTKGETNEEAFKVLTQIVLSKKILGGSGNIKGGFHCVCFAEAPQNTFHKVLGKYKPFGIKIAKSWLFEIGGRPVIYQSESEYDSLLEEMRWRHVRYEPNRNPPIDFTWEREWRIKTKEVPIEPNMSTIVVPGQTWITTLAKQFNDKCYYESLSWEDGWPMYEPEQFNWTHEILQNEH